MLLHKLTIGKLELENNIILAPMAGITDLAFRKIAKKYGPSLVFTEMVSAKALYYQDQKTKQLLNMQKEKRPVGIQIFGSEPEIMGNVAKNLSNQCEILDINMGCPAPKVVKNGDGSKLLLDLKLIEKIITEVVKNATVPVSIKIRKGWNEENVVAAEVAQIAQNLGASSITIHGRTREEFYSGKVDLKSIKKVKEAVTIPVIGNGDITTPAEAKQMLEYTGADGIMIGRATLGNPWILRQIVSYLKEGKVEKEPTKEEKLKTILYHIDLEIEEKGEQIGIKELRKHMSWYIKGLPDASKLRVEINKIETRKELENALKEYFKTV